MERSLRQLTENPGVRVLWSMKWPVLALPLIGYGLAGYPGMAGGSALLVGFWGGLGLLGVLLKSSIARYQRLRVRRPARCPYCLDVLEGRRVCPKCEEELPPIAFASSRPLLLRCPHCETSLSDNKPVVRCFATDCRGNPKNDGVGKFGDKPFRYALLVDADATGGKLDSPWHQGRASRKNEWWCDGGRYAVVLLVVSPSDAGQDSLPAELSQFDAIWLCKDAPDAVLLTLCGIGDSRKAQLFWEKVVGTVPEGLRMRWSVSREDFLATVCSM